MSFSQRIAAVLAATLGIVSSGLASDCAGDPGYKLTITPNNVKIGTPFTTRIQAPPGDLIVLLYSSTSGPTPSPYGTLCVGLPLLGTAAFVMPAGDVEFPHFVDCVPAYVGFIGHVQFVAASAQSQGVIHRSNSQTIKLVTGSCPTGGFYCGDLVTFRQSDWAADDCGKDSAGDLRDDHFDAVFPNDLYIGDDALDGDDDFAVKLTSSSKVAKFLPQDGKSGALKQNATNPTSTAAGQLAGELVAAKLNVAFDEAGKFDGIKKRDDLKLADMLFAKDVHVKLIGRSVLEVIALADEAIGGAAAMPLDVDGDSQGDVSHYELRKALEKFNANFEGGNHNEGVLVSP